MLLTIEQFDDTNHVQVSGDEVTVTFDRDDYARTPPLQIMQAIRDEVAEHAVAFQASDPVVLAGSDPVVIAGAAA